MWRTEILAIDGRLFETTVPGLLDPSRIRESVDALRIVPSDCVPASVSMLRTAMLPSAAVFALMRKLLSPPLDTMPPTRLSGSERAAMDAMASYCLASRGAFKRNGRIDLPFVASCYKPGGDRRAQPAVRKSLVFVDNRGGIASYVPPAPAHVPGLLKDLEGSCAAVIHARGSPASFALAFFCFLQFLAIHPLSDGNGRTSRLLFLKAAVACGVPEFLSSLVLGILHTLMVDALHASVMDYCLTGNHTSALGVFLLAVSKAKEAQHHPFWSTCTLVMPGFSTAEGELQANLAQFRLQYRGVAGVLA